MMQSSSRRISLLGMVALAVFAGAALISTVRADDFAGDVPTLVWIDAAWTANEVSTDVALQGKNGIGATIDFEQVFDMNPNRSTARMFGTARISPNRRYIDFGYVTIDRSGTRVIDQDLQWGDNVIQAGADLTAKFNTGFIYAAFRYDFLHLEQVHISGSAGMTWLELSTGLSGTASYTDPDGVIHPTASFDTEGSAGAPVPMVGLNLDWALARRLVLRGYSRVFRINISEFSGGLYESGIRLNWYFAKHFGLGIGYDRTDLNIKELKVGNGNIVKANYGFAGAGLFINLAF
jgi:hypothetical protein